MLEGCKIIPPNFYLTTQINKIEERFDLMKMWHVIEDGYDHKSTLKLIIDVPKDDGEIFIKTPVYGSLAKNLCKKWSNFLVIQLMSLFSRSAIKKMLGDFGMKCISESSFGANIF